jgi:hypothetical protein
MIRAEIGLTNRQIINETYSFCCFLILVERPRRNPNWLSISLSSSSDQDNKRSVSILVNSFDRTLTSTIGL